MRTRDEVQPVSDPYQFAAPYAWMLVKNGKPQGLPVAHRPSDWPDIERAWGATFAPLYPQQKSPAVLALLEREWIEACEIARSYCQRRGITEYGRSVFALLVEDAARMADRLRELEAQLTLPPIREKFVRVTDELVAELKAAPSKPVTVAIVEDGNELHMTFTESPQAASGAVAWADRLADAVRKLVRVLNDGDDVSALALALEATEKALAQFDDSKRCCGLCDAGECKYEIAPPSAAAVRVTDAMVRAAFVRLYPGCEPDEMQHYHAADIRAALTAALTRPTTPTRGSDE